MCDIGIEDLNDVYAQKNIDIIILSKITKFLKITSDTFLFMEKSYPKKNCTR